MRKNYLYSTSTIIYNNKYNKKNNFKYNSQSFEGEKIRDIEEMGSNDR